MTLNSIVSIVSILTIGLDHAPLSEGTNRSFHTCSDYCKSIYYLFLENVIMKTNITKSKAGHYTVTIRNDRGTVVFQENLIDNIHRARWIVDNEKKRIAESIPSDAQFMAALGPCGK
jgi:hypothetical protein